MKYTHIVFDWNGTLVNDLEINMNICNEMLSRRSLPSLYSKDFYLENFDFPIQPFYTYLGFDLENESFDDIAVEYDELYEKEMKKARLFGDVLEVLNMLKSSGVAMGIVSASMKIRLEEQTKRLQVSEYFDFCLGADDSKGDSKVGRLLLWMSQNQIDPQKVLFVGDTTHDAKAADAAKCDCVLISRGHNSKVRLQNTGKKVYDSLHAAFCDLFGCKSVLLAPDSFKGTLSSIDVCNILQKIAHDCKQNTLVRSIPIADGGEGTVDAILHIMGGSKVHVKVQSPLGNEIDAYYGLLTDNTAVIEMAQASGLNIDKFADATKASTFGTGQLIAHALSCGSKKIIIGLGGSATTDGGAGCIEALGAKLLNSSGEEIKRGGAGLAEIAHIDLANLDERINDVEFVILSDVTAPLFGKAGAAYVFAPQKGASKEEVIILDSALKNFAVATKNAIGIDYSNYPGAGAAGGLGFACLSFLKGKMHSGIDYILQMANFENIAENYDLIITGEGKMDAQSLMGKAPFGIAKRSGKSRVIAVVGQMDADDELAKMAGIENVYETNPEHKPFDQVKATAKEDMERTVKNMFIKEL